MPLSLLRAAARVISAGPPARLDRRRRLDRSRRATARVTPMSMPAPATAGPAPAARARALRHRWTDDYAWLRDPAYPEVNDPGDPRLSRGRERLLRGVHGAAPRPRRAAARRAQGADQGGRQLGAGARGRLRVPLALRAGRAVPGLVPPGRWRRPSRRCMLDENALAAGKGYFSLRALEVSPDGRLLAYTTDEDGSERFRAAPAGTSRPARSWPTSSPTSRARSNGPRTAARCSMSS